MTILHARALMDEGYVYAVDLDLSRFFDTLNQDILMNVVRETVKDRTLLKRWVKVQERCSDRRVPNGMHGGWRGRPVN